MKPTPELPEVSGRFLSPPCEERAAGMQLEMETQGQIASLLLPGYKTNYLPSAQQMNNRKANLQSLPVADVWAHPFIFPIHPPNGSQHCHHAWHQGRGENLWPSISPCKIQPSWKRALEPEVYLNQAGVSGTVSVARIASKG